MRQFEYKLLKYDAKGLLGGKVDLPQMNAEFDQLGQEGWELVSVFDTNSAYGESRWIVATFKRLKDGAHRAQ